jgi:hypothetical protein
MTLGHGPAHDVLVADEARPVAMRALQGGKVPPFAAPSFPLGLDLL